VTITIGTHPNNLGTWILSHRDDLQQPLREAAGEVRWERYDDGRKTIPFLTDGTIDVGATGSTPPIVAQADDLDVVYLAASEPHPDPGGIAVPAESSLHDLRDLKGQSIAFAVGSWQTHALAVAVDRAGLEWNDVTIVDVGALAHGREFLETQADSWLLVDPAFTQLQALIPLRLLARTEELVRNRSVFFGRGAYVRENQEAADAFVQAVGAAEDWASEHLPEVAELMSQSGRGDDVSTWLTALARREWGVHPVGEEFLAEQQHAADLFFRFGLIPREIRIQAAVAVR
jgi:sulfonate transport system substrate-binding protein